MTMGRGDAALSDMVPDQGGGNDTWTHACTMHFIIFGGSDTVLLSLSDVEGNRVCLYMLQEIGYCTVSTTTDRLEATGGWDDSPGSGATYAYTLPPAAVNRLTWAGAR